MKHLHSFASSKNQNDSSVMVWYIALLLTAIVVLIMLTVTTLVKAEPRLGTLQIHKLEAKSNASFGLSVAIGELQKALAPDRRIFATTDIFTGVQSLKEWDTAINVRQPNWTQGQCLTILAVYSLEVIRANGCNVLKNSLRQEEVHNIVVQWLDRPLIRR